MLNNNPGVHILAEPLLSLAGQHKKSPLQDVAAINELSLLISSMSTLKAEKSSTVIGFNEKFIYPKYLLPMHPQSLQSFATYLSDSKYR